MDFESNEVIDVSMQIEKSLGKLYRRFGDMFPKDATLWRTLSQEEKIHTLLLQETCFQTKSNSFINRLHDLKEVNKTITNKLNTYRALKECNKMDAFEDAIEIEAAIAKIHLDIAKMKKIGKKGLQAFLVLNRRNKDSLARLKKYASSYDDLNVAV
jgi:hypothetical protein